PKPSPSRSTRYSRSSSARDRTTAPGSTTYDAPPYSWTRVRTSNVDPSGRVDGTTSVSVPSALRRTSTCRPPSCGRPSSQYVSSPSTAGSGSRTESAVSASGVSGGGQDPNGAGVRASLLMEPSSLTTAAYVRATGLMRG